MSEQEEILFAVRGKMGLITLNRPKALNSLTLNMIEKMRDQMLAWREDDAIVGIIVQGAGEKAFCAGGDIRLLWEGKGSDLAYARRFYSEEYQLNTLIKEYPKPYIAMIDGIVMGGGVGISVHGAHRVCGEATLFAMPETGIGFYPDVGGTYFLPRLDGQLGTWMALTGARLRAADCLHAGVATDYAPSDQHEMIINRLCEDARNAEHVEQIIDSLTGLPGDAQVADNQARIDACFALDTCEAIMDALQRDGSDWARKQLSILSSKSPTSLKVTLRQMQEGKALDFRDCMKLELGLSMHFVAAVDFYEGVRALLIDKDNTPKWHPAHVSDVSSITVDSYFVDLPPEQQLRFLDGDAK